MAIPVPPAVSPPAVATDFDSTWAAWQAKGVVRQGAFNRTMAVTAPVLVFTAIVVTWLLAR